MKITRAPEGLGRALEGGQRGKKETFAGLAEACGAIADSLCRLRRLVSCCQFVALCRKLGELLAVRLHRCSRADEPCNRNIT